MKMDWQMTIVVVALVAAVVAVGVFVEGDRVDAIMGLLGGLAVGLGVRRGAVGAAPLVLLFVLATSMLVGCGASASDHAYTAVVTACDATEERIVESGMDDEEERLQCVRAVCNEALERIDPEATDGLD